MTVRCGSIRLRGRRGGILADRKGRLFLGELAVLAGEQFRAQAGGFRAIGGRTVGDGAEGCARCQFPAERVVDLQQHLLLALGEFRVGEHRCPHARVRAPVLQDPRLHVERLGGDPQPLGYLLQDLRAGPAQPALDLAEIRVGNPRSRRELAHRNLGLLALLADVLADGAYFHGIHRHSEPHCACNCKRPASTPVRLRPGTGLA